MGFLFGREGLLIAVISWVLVSLISLALYLLVIRPIWYETSYSEPIVDYCVVTNRNFYTTTVTTFIMSGKVMIPIINTVPHYDVSFECKDVNFRENSNALYSKVRLRDNIYVFYKESFISPRFYSGEKVFDGNVIESVEVVR
tara:strand:- start:112 stop:537 length:426 start_codon:yes stop_codon:yes gene_type:complete